MRCDGWWFSSLLALSVRMGLEAGGCYFVDGACVAWLWCSGGWEEMLVCWLDGWVGGGVYTA